MGHWQRYDVLLKIMSNTYIVSELTLRREKHHGVSYTKSSIQHHHKKAIEKVEEKI